MFIINFTFLSGYRDDQTLVKRDCNWNVFTIDGENWKKGQLVQIHHTSTGGINRKINPKREKYAREFNVFNFVCNF